MDPFGSWYQNPVPRSFSHSPSFFGMPVYHVDPTRETRTPVQHPPAQQKSGQKVVRIPVQFFGSDSDRRSESALKIQKVFRGLLVRKSVRKIKEIKSQVDEIEAKLLRSEVVEMVRGNERERLRMNENLMNLLFKLDGIRGVDLGVRVCRKGVTRKVIMLRERIDSIIAIDSKKVVRDPEIDNQDTETESPVENDSLTGTEYCEIENLEISDPGDMSDGWRKELEGTQSAVKEIEKGGMEVGEEIDTEVACDDTELVKSSNDCEENMGLSSVEDEAMEVEVKTSKEAGAMKRTPRYLDSDDKGESVKKMVVGNDGKEHESDKMVETGDEEKARNRKLKKMVEDNAKMMSTMARLYERNEVQLQMVDALTNRVNYLEKAYVCEKLRNRRKKKKKNKAAAAFCRLY